MTNRKSQSGFTFLEMMVSMVILLMITAAAFQLLNTVQTRKNSEEKKIDILEESREFVDELSRDLRNSGFPGAAMYGCGRIQSGAAQIVNPGCPLGANPQTSTLYASGLVAVSATDILFEGDVNQDGNIDSVRYQLTAAAGGTCPCSLFRSQVPKNPGWPYPNGVSVGANGPGTQGNSFNVEVDNVINSTGGLAPYPISGNTPNGTANDVYYATFKAAPVFTYYDVNNAVMAVPNDLSAANFAAGAAAAANVRTVLITLNILSPTPDLTTKLRPGVTMRTMVRISNF